MEISDQTFSSLVKPECSIRDLDKRVTGISDEMVRNAPLIWEILPNFLRFIEGSILIAHNASFDESALIQSCEVVGINWTRPLFIDTLKMARRLIQGKGFGLQKLKKDFGIKTKSHRALGDCFAVAKLFPILIEKALLEQPLETVKQLVDWLYNRKEKHPQQMDLFQQRD